MNVFVKVSITILFFNKEVFISKGSLKNVILFSIFSTISICKPLSTVGDSSCIE